MVQFVRVISGEERERERKRRVEETRGVKEETEI